MTFLLSNLVRRSAKLEAVAGMPRRIVSLAEHLAPVLLVTTLLGRKSAYRRRLRHDDVVTGDARVTSLVNVLRRDGIVVIPSLLDNATISKMLDAIPPKDEFQESPDGERSYSYWEADRIRELAPFFESRLIRDVARNYISRSVLLFRCTIGLKVQPGNLPSFEAFYHIDSWKHRLKAFLYLEDVGADDGPLTYLQGSHSGLWRLPMESRLGRLLKSNSAGFTTQPCSYLGCFWPYEVDQLKRSYGYTETTCTGPAGTLVIFDGRGLHCGKELRSARRLILTSYWIHPGDHT